MNKFKDAMMVLADNDALNVKPILAYVETWGSGFLSFAAGIAAIYSAVMIVITAFKAAKAEDAETKKAMIKSIIWKVIWFLVAISGAVIFAVLSATVSNNA